MLKWMRKVSRKEPTSKKRIFRFYNNGRLDGGFRDILARNHKEALMQMMASKEIPQPYWKMDGSFLNLIIPGATWLVEDRGEFQEGRE